MSVGHRGARLVAGPRGSCGRRLTCPYHGWSYALDGRLVGVPFRRDYDGLNADALGLAPVELETFLGFVFARVESGGPTVAEMMAPYADELGAYRIAEMMPLGRVTLRRRPVNWNTVADKAGCRVIVQAFYNGTDVATPEIDAETYAAINRALSQAVRRLNADKRAYVHYFIDLDPAEEVKALTVDDFNLNRLVYIEPGTPIPEDELQRTYDWMVSWDLIGEGLGTDDLVNTRVAAMADD